LGIGNRSIAAARRTLRLHSSRRLRRRGCGRQPGKDFGLEDLREAIGRLAPIIVRLLAGATF
jgi:hypothetical protein